MMIIFMHSIEWNVKYNMFGLENKFSGTESKFEPIDKIKITTKLITTIIE